MYKCLRNVDKKANNSRDRNDMRKLGGRRNHYTRRNTMKQNKKIGSMQRTGKGRQTIMGEKQNCLCG